MKSQTKILLISNIIILTILVWLLIRENYPQRIYQKLNPSEIKESNSKISYWFSRDELFEVLPKDSNSIVFLGNSLTQQFELAELFRNVNMKNRGIVGDITKGVLQRLNPIVALQPKQIFIEIGINDLFMNIPQDTLLQNYAQIIDTIKLHCPKTKLYIQSIFPVSNSKPSLETFDTKKINDGIKLVNEKLKRLASSKKTNYIDLYNKFVLNGELADKYTTDGLHLNGGAYMLWTETLKPYIEE